MNNLYVIVVIYNVNIEDSESCKALLNNKTDFNVIIADNSTRINSNEKFCLKRGWKYISMYGNKGLSKAYNKAISEIHDKDYWAVMLDQDTILQNEYFKTVIDSIEDKPEMYLKIPVVKNKNSILSPSIINKHAVKKLENIKNINDLDSITAINTGMIICSKVFEKIKYDERYFLDYIDHQFIRQFKKYFREKIEILEIEVQQNFSDDDHSNINGDISRFKIYKNDFRLFCCDSFTGWIYYLLKIIFRGLKLSLIHKNPVFINLIINKNKN